MRRYWKRLENCRYRPLWRSSTGTGHRCDRAWLGGLARQRVALPREALRDDELVDLVIGLGACGDCSPPGIRCAACARSSSARPTRTTAALAAAGSRASAIRRLSTRSHQRVGARERVLDVAARYPDRLRIVLHALATRIVFDERRSGGRRRVPRGRASLPGGPGRAARRRQASAAPDRRAARGDPRRRRVQLAAAADAVGHRSAPRSCARHGISVRVDLPGVGRNLQDRYEIGVVNRLKRPWAVLDGARFERDDRLYREWRERREGMYISNGAAIALARRSAPDKPDPDLFLMALLARFSGYYPGYSREIVEHHDYLTWAILKAHTANRAGSVTLRSADPRDTPEVNFRYFDEGDDRDGDDLRAVVSGIRLARRLADGAEPRAEPIAEEELPGAQVQTDAQLAEYVRDNAWGHHASGTCAIGPRERNGVLAPDFTVHGTRGLRVVDASVFPRIPGFFIASAVYMVAEKAADVILSEARGGPD